MVAQAGQALAWPVSDDAGIPTPVWAITNERRNSVIAFLVVIGDAPLMFRGSFESAMEQVFELYRTAQKPLYAQASRMQCIITVSDTRDGR